MRRFIYFFVVPGGFAIYKYIFQILNMHMARNPIKDDLN